jgi:cell division protein FtsW
MRAAARARPAKAKLPLEYNLLLTATLCLLALGAVMVYSASSARTLLQGQGDGTTYLVRYVVYGAIGFVALQVIARRGLDAVVRLTGPLLAFSFVCLVAVKLPGLGVSVNGARRWLGAGPLTFQPSEVAKLALILYAAKFLAQKSGRIRSPRNVSPLLLMTGTMALLVASQPDLGTTLVIAFTLTAMLIAAGLPVRYLLIGAGIAAFLVTVYALSEPSIPGATPATRASRRCRARSRSARAGCSGAASASRCRRSSTCPRPTPTSSWPSSARSSAWPG